MEYKYLFFDIECANTYLGEGKICSFGYVLCDNNFNIIEKKDILINPKASFDKNLFTGKYGCKLFYSEDEFKKNPTFKGLFSKIKKIFNDLNTLFFGWGVENDVDYIVSECLRYDLEHLYFKTFNTQLLFKKYYQSEKIISLEKAKEILQIDEAINLHKSDDDAMLNLLVIKKIVEENKKNLSDEYVNFDEALIVCNEEKYHEVLTRHIKNKQKRDKMILEEKIQKELRNFYNGSYKVKINDELKNNKYYISKACKENNLEEVKEVAKYILQRQGVLLKRNKGNYIICSKKEIKYFLKSPKVIENRQNVILIDDFYKMIFHKNA